MDFMDAQPYSYDQLEYLIPALFVVLALNWWFGRDEDDNSGE